MTRDGQRPPSLSRRILSAFGLLGLLFTLAAAGLLVATYESGQESVSQKLLVGEVQDYLARRAVDPGAAPPSTVAVKSYVGDGLPARYREHLHRFEAEDYEVPLREWNEIQLWQGTDSEGRPLYVVLDLGATADSAIRDPNLLRLFLVWLPLLGIFALWLGWILSRRLSAPLSRLTEEVTRYDPSRRPQGREPARGDAEVATLGRAFDSMQERIGRFVEREREFTRFASHELRTPITVARGSAEVLRRALPTPSPRVDRALGGLEQAVRDMSTTVELFLWLARGESSSRGETPTVETRCATGELVRRLVEEHRPLLAGRDVELVLDIEAESHDRFPADPFRIAVSNLIRNACQHTSTGRIQVRLSADRLVVEDTGKGMSEELLRHVREPLVRGTDGEGSGLGVTIVDRIATRCGWRLELESEPGQGTRTILHWGDSGL